MSTTAGPPGPFYENTLIDRCRRAYDEAPGWGTAHPKGIALVLEHLAAEIMAQQHMRGSMDAHDVARLLLESSRPQTLRTGHPAERGHLTLVSSTGESSCDGGDHG